MKKLSIACNRSQKDGAGCWTFRNGLYNRHDKVLLF
jgi:hypothetical protein